VADTNRNVERRQQDPASEPNALRGRVFLFYLPIPNQQGEEDRAHDQHDHDGREDDEAAGDEDVGVGHVIDGSSIAKSIQREPFLYAVEAGPRGLKPGR
jgi:hypothetical protein